MLQERMKKEEGLTMALPSVQQKEAAPEDQFSPGLLGVESRGLNCAKSLLISILAGRRGGVAQSEPVLTLFYHLPQSHLSPCALSMLLRHFPSCCSKRPKFWLPNANRNRAQDSVGAQQRLCHTKEAEAHMAPCVNRRIEVLCILPKSEICDVLHSSHSNLKEWWNYSLLLLFLRLFWCHSNCWCWIFNHLTFTDPNLLMFWQFSFVSHPFITPGVRHSRGSVGKKASQYASRAHRSAEWKTRKNMQITMFDSLLLTHKPEWTQPETP